MLEGMRGCVRGHNSMSSFVLLNKLIRYAVRSFIKISQRIRVQGVCVYFLIFQGVCVCVCQDISAYQGSGYQCVKGCVYQGVCVKVCVSRCVCQGVCVSRCVCVYQGLCVCSTCFSNDISVENKKSQSVVEAQGLS